MIGKWTASVFASAAAFTMVGCGTRMDLGLVGQQQDDAGASVVDSGAQGSLVTGEAGALRTWSWVSPNPTPYAPLVANGLAKDDIWIAGAHGMLAHWDGKDKVEMARVGDADENLGALWESTPTDVWASGNKGVGHWDGAAWKSDFNVVANAFWGASPDDVWAVAETASHWDGHAWSANLPESVIATLPGRTFLDVWGSSTTDVWTVGTLGAIAHYDGTTWAVVTPPADISDTSHYDFMGIWGTGPNDVWTYFQEPSSSGATIDVGFAHWNGTSWTSELHPSVCWVNGADPQFVNGRVTPAPFGQRVWGTSTGTVVVSPAASSTCEWTWSGSSWVGYFDAATADHSPALWGVGDTVYAINDDVRQISATPSTGVWGFTDALPAVTSREVAVSAEHTWSDRIVYAPDTTSPSWSVWSWSGTAWEPKTPSGFVNASDAGAMIPSDLSVDLVGNAWLTSSGNGQIGYPDTPTRVARFDGTTWTELPALDESYGDSAFLVRANGPSDAFAYDPIGDGGVLHWDGSKWARAWQSNEDLPAALHSSSAGKAFFAVTTSAVSSPPDIVVEQWDGVQTKELFRRANAGQALSVTGMWSSDEEIWVTGFPTLHWNGTSYDDLEIHTNGVWGTGPNDVWLIEAPGTLAHWDGQSLTVEKQTDISLTSISGNANEVWVSGARGATLRLSAAGPPAH